ncbi:anti sigma factor C-terminal domain-containing protein [Clostridium fallax]|uniref:Sigma factor regulator N-terminal n=1 Tax=Clostridium fallax TaxID=1533 RepID=A0A1M4Y007_9CLOT|nr:anti sigma factor C-terminal domain-containing protein [Clostridium fallax]SHE98903.1 Sigma factor regulator N-terminal [Clostridium fallax]SQB06498.1 Uncharacterised protein [Clostridium fallax]
MKSDDEKLKELFLNDDNSKNSFENLMRKTKIFSVIKTIIIELMIFVILIFIILIINAKVLNDMSNRKERYLKVVSNISMPNNYIGNMQTNDVVFTGRLEYTKYKFLGNKPIFDGNYKEEYTYLPLVNCIYGESDKYLFNRSGDDLEDLREYNKIGRPIMEFYHPSIKYKSYRDDLKNIKDIEDNKLIEMSISFDKEYTLDEIREIIPKDVTLNWCWINTLNKDDISKINGYESDSEKIFNEYSVYGFKNIDNQGKYILNAEEKFIDSINILRNNKDYKNRYEKLINTLSGGQGEIKKENLKIIGVVISGNKNQIELLENNENIKASTIGAIAERY